MLRHTFILALLCSAIVALTTACGTATGPVTTCDCPDTTMRANGLLAGILDAPLTQLVITQRSQSLPTGDSTYLSIFAGAEQRAGRAGTTLNMGTCTIGPRTLQAQTKDGTTMYTYLGVPGFLPTDTTLTIGFDGNTSAGVAPYQTTLYIGAPLDVTYNGVQGAKVADTLGSDEDIILRWTPSKKQPMEMVISVELRTANGTVFNTMDYTGPDDGREVIPAIDLPNVQTGAYIITILAERSFVRCSCQPSMQYNIASITDQVLVRRVK